MNKHHYVPCGPGYGALCDVCGKAAFDEVHECWVNSDLLRMAGDLDHQAIGIGDEEDPEDKVRPNIHEASAYLRLAYATLARIPVAGYGRHDPVAPRKHCEDGSPCYLEGCQKCLDRGSIRPPKAT